VLWSTYIYTYAVSSINYQYSQISLTSNVTRLFSGHFTETLETSTMSLVISVRKVEARHVHTGIHKDTDAFFGPASRTHRADDFRTTAFGGRLACDHVERNQIAMELGNGTCIGKHLGVWEGKKVMSDKHDDSEKIPPKNKIVKDKRSGLRKSEVYFRTGEILF
jgi:hypothetical protein